MQHLESMPEAAVALPEGLRDVELFHLRRFLRFGLVGGLGVLVNTAILYLLTSTAGVHYLVAALPATEVAILFNFVLNDRWTFRATQPQLAWQWRIARYNVIAFVGMIISIAALAALTHLFRIHYLIANLGGIACAMVWNYAGNSIFTWRRQGHKQPHRWREAPVRLWVRHRAGMHSTVAMGAVLLAVGWIILTIPSAWITIAALGLGVALAVQPGLARRQASILLLAPVVGVSAIDYLTWRWSMVNWQCWWIALPLFLAESFGALHTLGFQYTAWPRPEPRVDACEDPTLRPIFIFIPTVNEGDAILEPTLRGALAARDRYLDSHPQGRVTIVVCNDGLVAHAPNWQEVEVLARRLGVVCVTRTVGGGAKAGNIEAARLQLGATGDALLVIFDADQIAEPEFLLQTVAPFADPTIGWVQTGQYYSNLDNPVARWANDQQALFYQVLCPGKAAQNAAFICGTNVVLRAAALDEIGGLPQDSVTEDFAASIMLHPRWRSLFLTDVLARGLGPMDLKSYFSQQRRWAIGTLGVLRSHWRSIFLPQPNGLRLAQRLQYGLACTHYLCGVRDLIYLVAPLVFLATGAPAVRGADLPAFLAYFLPYWLASQIAFWYVGWRKTSMRGIVIGFGSFPILISSTLTTFLGRRIGFAVTAKRRGVTNAWAALIPHILSLAGCMVVVGVAVDLRGVQGSVLVSLLWVLYSLLMLSSMLWLGVMDIRGVPWAGARYLRWRGQISLACRRATRPILAAALILVIVGAVFEAEQTPVHALPFEPRQVGHPYLGISLPVELLASRPPLLERRLGFSFGIVGRTQVIGDSFDQAWAGRLAERGAHPWVTLLFGVPGVQSLAASLPAIANGLHDDALRRWARDIRSYGQPVYLSLLPHADRNWSLSSAVTNGGIPQDVSRVWNHVRSIFRAEGAGNVAWVWAPADPAHDSIYAPPAAAINVVLLSLISYPRAIWADPTSALAAVVRRYPAKPLFLEVSVAGDARRKAAWLQTVGRAVARAHTVYALIYHEGSPNIRATLAEHAQWSIASSPGTLPAFQDAVRMAQIQLVPPAAAHPQHYLAPHAPMVAQEGETRHR